MQVNTDGATLWVERSGRNEGPVVMLSHSLGSGGVMWEPQLQVLEPLFQVVRFDTRGHGRSAPLPGPYSFEGLARDAIGVLDFLGIEKAHFVGLSMGGMIGQALAIRYPKRLSSLTLCDTAASNPPGAREIWRERIAQAEREGLSPLLAPTFERWFTPQFLNRNPPILEKIRAQFLATSVEGFIGCCRAIMELNFLPQLSAVAVPTLVMVGEHDPGTPVSVARELAAAIAGARLEILPEARHLSNVEQAEEFNRALLAFLALDR